MGHLTNCMCEKAHWATWLLAIMHFGDHGGGMGDDVREGPGATPGALLKLGMRAGKPTRGQLWILRAWPGRAWSQQRCTRCPPTGLRAHLICHRVRETHTRSVHTHTHKGRYSLSLLSSLPEEPPAPCTLARAQPGRALRAVGTGNPESTPLAAWLCQGKSSGCRSPGCKALLPRPGGQHASDAQGSLELVPAHDT